jgi:cytochrome c oxidase subunit 2
MLTSIQDPLGQLPPANSTFASDVDGLYYFVTWVCLFFFVLITAIQVYSIVKWRRRAPDQPAASNVTHNTPLEVTWTVVPLIIVMVMFAWGWRGSLAMTVAPVDALQYEVEGAQWAWTVKHPKGQKKTNEIYVPVDTPIKVTLSSRDVLHSFFLPAMRVKRDVLPGRYQMVWFRALHTGTFDMFCTEYCGQDHSYMIGKIHVVSQEDWAAGKYPPKPPTPEKHGEELFLQCRACHMLNGIPLVGPPLNNLFGREEEVLVSATGKYEKIKVDEAYFRESLKDPQAKLVKGFDGPTSGKMTPMGSLTEEEVQALIAFLKTQK